MSPTTINIFDTTPRMIICKNNRITYDSLYGETVIKELRPGRMYHLYSCESNEAGEIVYLEEFRGMGFQAELFQEMTPVDIGRIEMYRTHWNHSNMMDPPDNSAEVDLTALDYILDTVFESIDKDLENAKNN
ncbi:MAG: hypothetical protein K5744_09145 [Eubacterium sp.]|nr:hypothetical protein [Eubacterium sp.]